MPRSTAKTEPNAENKIKRGQVGYVDPNSRGKRIKGSYYAYGKVSLYLTKQEKATVDEQAKKAGKTTNTYIREKIGIRNDRPKGRRSDKSLWKTI